MVVGYLSIGVEGCSNTVLVDPDAQKGERTMPLA